MRCSPHTSTGRQHLALVTVIGGVFALLALISSAFGDPLYLAIAELTERSVIAPAISLTAKAGLLALAGLAGITAAWSFRWDRRAFWALVVACVGGVTAYLLSEGLKLLVAEERPCHVLDRATALACPGPGDWSWPSNHATLAAAFATACALAVPRTLTIGAPAALLIAFSRVGAGVHDVHDVLSGLALGALTVALVVAISGFVAGCPARRGGTPCPS